MTRRGLILFISLGVIWGLPYLLIKVSVREVSPALLVFVRTGGGTLILLPIAATRRSLRGLVRHWRPIIAYTVAEICIPWVLLFNAERKLSSSLAGLLIAAVPLVGALLAVLTGSDRLDARRSVGLLIGFAGVAALVGFAVGRSDIWAAASLGAVVVGYALGPWILARYLSDLPPLGVVAASLLIAAIIYAPVASFQLPSHRLSGSVIASVVVLTVVCTAVAFVVFFALIGEVGAYRATIITYLNPAVAVLLGVTVLGEHFGVATAVGFGLILTGCFFATRSTRPSPPGQPVPAVAEP